VLSPGARQADERGRHTGGGRGAGRGSGLRGGGNSEVLLYCACDRAGRHRIGACRSGCAASDHRRWLNQLHWAAADAGRPHPLEFLAAQGSSPTHSRPAGSARASHIDTMTQHNLADRATLPVRADQRPMPDYVPLSQKSVATLRMEAAQYRRMAATARVADTQSSLLRLADRIDGLADQREHEACGGGSPVANRPPPDRC